MSNSTEQTVRQRHTSTTHQSTPSSPPLSSSSSAADTDSFSIPLSAADIDSMSTDELVQTSLSNNRDRLPAPMRQYFEQRKNEILKQYPDFMTKEIPAASSPSPFPVDKLVFLIGIITICILLYVEYNVNIFTVIDQLLTYLLDPGTPASATDDYSYSHLSDADATIDTSR